MHIQTTGITDNQLQRQGQLFVKLRKLFAVFVVG